MCTDGTCSAHHVERVIGFVEIHNGEVLFQPSPVGENTVLFPGYAELWYGEIVEDINEIPFRIVEDIAAWKSK